MQNLIKKKRQEKQKRVSCYIHSIFILPSDYSSIRRVSFLKEEEEEEEEEKKRFQTPLFQTQTKSLPSPTQERSGRLHAIR